MGKKRIIQLEGTTSITSNDYLGIDSSADGTRKIDFDSFKAAVNNGQATDTDLATAVANFAAPYDSTASYVAGDYCIEELVLYKCTSPTTGTWDSTKWESTTIAEIISTIDLSAEAISYDNASSGLEAENVQDAIDETITKLSAVGSASGDIATFTDGSALPMPSLKVAIEPQQDLHGYDYPWPAGGGKNKFQTIATSKTEGGVTWTVNSDGTVTVSGTATEYSSLALGDAKVNSSMGNIVISGIGGTTNIAWGGVELRDSNNNVLLVVASGGTYSYFTVDLSQYPTAYRITMSVKRNNNGAVSGVIKPQVELGQAVTTYEPYSNICPISGHTEANLTRTGKNLWGGEKLADDIVSKVPNATKDTTNKTVAYSAGYVSGKVLFDNFKPNTIYTIFMMTSSSANNVMVRYTDGTNTYINKDTITVTQANKSIECIIGIWSTGTTVLKYDECGIFEGVLTAEDFVPYNGQVYTIDLDGTRYGGTLNVLSGVLMVDRVEVDLGSIDYSVTNNHCFYTIAIASIKSNTTASAIPNIICSAYKTGSASQSYNGTVGNCISIGIDGLIGDKRISIYDSNYSDATAFKTAMNGVQLVYELATPTTIQLTPTQVKSLLGANNAWADTGDIISAKYVRDLTSTINYILEQLNS